MAQGFWSVSSGAWSHADTAVPGGHRSLPLGCICLASANCCTGGAERTGGAAANRRSHPYHPTGTGWPGCCDHHHLRFRAVRSKKGESILMETTSNLLSLAEKREEQLSRVLEKIY